MELTILTDDERADAFPVLSQAFLRGDRDMREMEGMAGATPHTIVGVREGAGLQATVVVLHYRCHFGPEVVLPMGGIAGVACRPEARGRGYAGAALRRSLEVMRDAGEVVSALFPFSWAYYRRFGWEWVGVGRRYTVPARVLQPDSGAERVRAAGPDDGAAIRALYGAFAGRYRGMLDRSDAHWAGILDHGEKQFTYTYLHEGDRGPEGYLTYRGGSHDETELREFVCLSADARRALLGLLRRHDMQTRAFAWAAPEDDALWSQGYHWEIETRVAPRTQARVVDVAGALQAWRPTAGVRGAMTLAVADSCAPWNDGTWRVECEEGRIAAARGAGPPDVSMDIQAFSQATWGTPQLPALRAAGRVTVHDEAGFALLRDMLAGPPMWMNDGF